MKVIVIIVVVVKVIEGVLLEELLWEVLIVIEISSRQPWSTCSKKLPHAHLIKGSE